MREFVFLNLVHCEWSGVEEFETEAEQISPYRRTLYGSAENCACMVHRQHQGSGTGSMSA